MNEGLELAQELNERRSIVFALVLLAAFAIDAGDDERAGRCLAQVEVWGEDPGDRIDVSGLVLVNRGILARRLGDLQQASRERTGTAGRALGLPSRALRLASQPCQSLRPM